VPLNRDFVRKRAQFLRQRNENVLAVPIRFGLAAIENVLVADSMSSMRKPSEVIVMSM
jgi:hypothetical protein